MEQTSQKMYSNATTEAFGKQSQNMAGDMVQTHRIHKVGTITLGGTLIVFGVLFILRVVVSWINYLFIFHMWPLILIGLGLELLIANSFRDSTIVYDKGAIFLLLVMSVFAMGMGGIEFLLEHASRYVVF